MGKTMSDMPDMVRESISKEEVAELPLRQFEGEMVVVESPAGVHEAVRELRGYPVLGFDTETKPSFRKGDNHQVALLQLSTHQKAYLFRVKKTGIPPDLKQLLADPGVLKAGVAIRDDLKALQKIVPFRPGGFIELQDQAQSLGIRDFSLKKLSAILLGFRVSKSQQLSNWEADQLTAPQMAYASTDAWASLLIYDKLQQLLP